MFEENCQDLDHLPIHLSWNRHCEGSWWGFTNYDKYAGILSIEESWQGHLDRVRINYE